MIRVFARKTKWTPRDNLAFYDSPHMYELPNKELGVCVSVTFSWDIERGKQLQRDWQMAGYFTSIGGPAFGGTWDSFIPGRFVKKGVTFTSRGCPKNCSYCLVPHREGKIREIEIQPGYIVQDNNLLACKREHIEKVFEMLAGQKRGAQFKGGLDIDYLQHWHIELLKKIKVAELWVACDTMADMSKLDKAADLFSDFSIAKLRCYVLVGYNGENQVVAQERCKAVYRKGFLPYAQLYRGVDAGPSRGDWHDFCHFWTDPGKYRKAELYGI